MFACSLIGNTPITYTWDKIRRVNIKEPEQVKIIEVDEVQYKNNKSIANKISDTLADLSLPHFWIRSDR